MSTSRQYDHLRWVIEHALTNDDLKLHLVARREDGDDKAEALVDDQLAKKLLSVLNDSLPTECDHIWKEDTNFYPGTSGFYTCWTCQLCPMVKFEKIEA